MEIFNQTIRGFLDKAGSKAPTPGGGSVAAVAAALGASMGSMVANLTMGPKYEAVQEKMAALVNQMRDGMTAYEAIAKQDMDSFQQYMDALGLPKGTAEEKAARSCAIQDAAKQSAEVPMCLMRQSLELMMALAEITETANKNVISDLAIAFFMLESAIQSAWITVEINLSGIKDESFVCSYRDSGSAILSQCISLKSEALRKIRLILSL